jgi:hypothetical protein
MPTFSHRSFDRAAIPRISDQVDDIDLGAVSRVARFDLKARIQKPSAPTGSRHRPDMAVAMRNWQV